MNPSISTFACTACTASTHPFFCSAWIDSDSFCLDNKLSQNRNIPKLASHGLMVMIMMMIDDTHIVVVLYCTAYGTVVCVDTIVIWSGCECVCCYFTVFAFGCLVCVCVYVCVLLYLYYYGPQRFTTNTTYNTNNNLDLLTPTITTTTTICVSSIIIVLSIHEMLFLVCSCLIRHEQ